MFRGVTVPAWRAVAWSGSVHCSWSFAQSNSRTPDQAFEGVVVTGFPCSAKRIRLAHVISLLGDLVVFGRQQVVPSTVFDGFTSIIDASLVVDVRYMPLDGPDAEHELFGNLGVAVPVLQHRCSASCWPSGARHRENGGSAISRGDQCRRGTIADVHVTLSFVGESCTRTP